MTHTYEDLEVLKNELYAQVSQLAHTNGIGTTWDEATNGYAFQINLVEETSAELPSSYKDIPIVYEVIGVITLLSA